MNYKIIGQGNDEVVTVFDPSLDAPLAAHNTHPNYEAILSALRTEADVDLVELFDVGKAIEARFERIGERVTVRGETLFLDNDPIHNSLTEQVLRVMNEGGDFHPLVRFFEAVQANPSDNSRTQLFAFLQENVNSFSIGDDGSILGYKGVQYTDEEGVYQSTHAGGAIVNGEAVTGKVRQKVGDVVEMPRSEVADNADLTCSTGLHVSTFGYAESYARSGVMLLVRFSPRDVVSVPNEAGSEKVRVCRYQVEGVVEYQVKTALYDVDADLYDEDDEFEAEYGRMDW